MRLHVDTDSGEPIRRQSLAEQASEEISREGISAFFDSTPITGLLISDHNVATELPLQFSDGSVLVLTISQVSTRSETRP